MARPKRSHPATTKIKGIAGRNTAKAYTYTVHIHRADADETGFWVDVPTLPGCVTQAETYEEALANAQEAIQLYVEGLVEEGLPIPTEHPKRPPEKVVMSIRLPAVA